jgi:flagellar motor switch protein FliN/FliY
MSDSDQIEADAISDDWAAAMSEQAVAESASAAAPAAQAADIFEQFSASAKPGSSGANQDFDMILDIPVSLGVELGRTRISIRNLLQLAHGSVVELDGLAGEPLDVLVNGTLIAQGEVVVVNDKFGIRLTDIITPAERMRKLQHR